MWILWFVGFDFTLRNLYKGLTFIMDNKNRRKKRENFILGIRKLFQFANVARNNANSNNIK